MCDFLEEIACHKTFSAHFLEEIGRHKTISAHFLRKSLGWPTSNSRYSYVELTFP